MNYMVNLIYKLSSIHRKVKVRIIQILHCLKYWWGTHPMLLDITE